MNRTILLIAMTAFALFAGCNNKQHADLIVHNAVVYTVDESFSQAEAFAVKDGHFIAVGTNDEILQHYTADSLIDAKGAPIYPGFMDGHCHFKSLGETMIRYADLVGCTSFDEVIQRLQEHAAKHPSQWLLGRGWDQNLWPGKQFPDNKLFPDRYVAITRIDGHMGLINDRLLRLMHFDSPTGLLLDAPYDSVKAAIPRLTRQEQCQALMAAQQACFANGLSRGANLLEPYSDDPDNRGIQLYPLSYYDSLCRMAYDAGFQVCTHAIGDAGVRNILHAYSSVLEGSNDRRWRIEHSQIVHPDDFHLFGENNIIPSIQSTHATSDMAWAEERIGKRVENAYAYQRLLQQNGWVVNGTDFPIEHISPLYTFYAAVSRQNLEGQPVGGWQPEDSITRQQALRSITCWVAKGYFEEDRKGSIEKGKEADFVILEQDIMVIPLKEIPSTGIRRLFISGSEVPVK